MSAKATETEVFSLISFPFFFRIRFPDLPGIHTQHRGNLNAFYESLENKQNERVNRWHYVSPESVQLYLI